jgi:hypothetical protein
MPTGYTAELSEKDQTFEAFVWNCARAFGALVLMRDDPADKPVPEKLEANDFYASKLVKTKSELAEWDGSSDVQRRAMHEAERLANERVAEQSREKAAATKKRYDEMAERVRVWNPPSTDHIGLKSFMLEQIEKSREFDCRPYEPGALPPFDEWVTKHRTDLIDRVVRYAGEAEKELDRNESRQRWVDQLRASVPQPVKP